MKVREALAAGARRLTEGSATPRLDAELLMAHLLGAPRETMLLSRLEQNAPAGFDALLDRRAAGEPIAYMIGRRDFWTISLGVAPGVLIPRPDSETLIEAALARFGATGPRAILDLGTGSGALLLAALDQWPEAYGVGVDRSEIALAMAQDNARRLGLAGRARFERRNWGEGISESFDLILCNPPYVEEGAPLPRDVAGWEPPEALFAGEDGLDAYRALAPQLGALIAERGIACVEMGAGQAADAARLFAAEGLTSSPRNDLGGHVRCLVLSH